MAFFKKYKWVLAAVLAVACLLSAVWLCLPTPEEAPTAVPESTTTAPITTPEPVTETTTTTTTEAETTTSSEAELEQTTTSFTTTTAAPKVKLTVTSHKSKDITTDEPITTFTGTSDPKYTLKINGKEVERDKLGAFSVEYDLKPGKNTFTFSHQGKETTYVVRYRYVVMQS